MITQEQKDRYQFQQTEAGKQTVQMLEQMKSQYCKNFKIPPSKIKTGKLKPLVNSITGKIDRFIEE